VTSSPLPEAGSGLCATCAHSRIVSGARSVFVRCGLSDSDSRFARYPPLPVRDCDGYEWLAAASDTSGEPTRPPAR